MKNIEDFGGVVMEITLDDTLLIKLTPEGIKELKDTKNDYPSFSEEHIFFDIMVPVLCNSDWDFILPEEIVASTAGTILSKGSTRDDNGKLIKPGKVFWHSNYQLESMIETLEQGIALALQGANT